VACGVLIISYSMGVRRPRAARRRRRGGCARSRRRRPGRALLAGSGLSEARPATETWRSSCTTTSAPGKPASAISAGDPGAGERAEAPAFCSTVAYLPLPTSPPGPPPSVRHRRRDRGTGTRHPLRSRPQSIWREGCRPVRHAEVIRSIRHRPTLLAAELGGMCSMPQLPPPGVLLDGLAIGESPRWHHGRLARLQGPSGGEPVAAKRRRRARPNGPASRASTNIWIESTRLSVSSSTWIANSSWPCPVTDGR
jgi:hypothetical protein